MPFKSLAALAGTALALWAACPVLAAEAGGNIAVRHTVDSVIPPLMRAFHIPGMAVGIVAHGHAHVFDYGLASLRTGQPVTDSTLFEIGSLSKTFTATLATYAVAAGKLSLSDAASADLPALHGSAFDHVAVRDLGTHTSGGLPLQVPDRVIDRTELIAYLRAWRPSAKPGASRLYSNVGTGLLGMIAARRLHGDFPALVRQAVFRPLGMTRSFYRIPARERANYAQGYTKTGAPIRMAPGVFDAEAYGVRTTAADMLRFLDANLGAAPAGTTTLARAIAATHTGYVQVGPMTQDLMWEQYAWPVRLADLLAGNGDAMAFTAHPAAAIVPPSPPQRRVLINKTGSTNGFAAYAALVPAADLGVVLLANRNYPVAARVTAAYRILTALDGGEPIGR